jgi:hypothetical protein
VCLGGCNSNFNFIGGLRDFLVLTRPVTRDQAIILKNQYLSWDSTVLAYYRFTDETFLKDFYRMNQLEVVHPRGTDLKGRDYSANDICSPLADIKLYHEFNSSRIEVQPVGLDIRWIPRSTGWQYSVNMWVLIRSDSCSEINPLVAVNTCYLLELNDAFVVYQP